jgi:hypothetical protein
MAIRDGSLPTLKTPSVRHVRGGNPEWGAFAIAASVGLNLLFLWFHTPMSIPGSRSGDVRPVVIPSALATDFSRDTTLGQAELRATSSISRVER